MKVPTWMKIQRQDRKRDFVLVRLILLLTVDSTDGLGTKSNVLMQQDRSSTCWDAGSFPCTAEKVFYAHSISNMLAFKRAWWVQTLLRDLKCRNSNQEQISWANEESTCGQEALQGQHRVRVQRWADKVLCLKTSAALALLKTWKSWADQAQEEGYKLKKIYNA